MGKTSIEWTRGDDGAQGASWNPIRARDLGPVGTGPGPGWHCEILSPGCVNCYAQAMNMRLGTHRAYLKTSRHSVNICIDEKTLAEPLRWRKPRRIFVCSMSDLFGEWVPDEMIDRVFAVMELCPQHTFLVLTKRADRMRDYMSAPMKEPLPNVWLGVSVEDQRRADERVPLLLDTPAAVRWVSYEPALQAVDYTAIRYTDGDAEIRINALTAEAWVENSQSPSAYTNEADGNPRLDWIVIGGESGIYARPFDVAWARSIIAQCKAAGVPAFVKQIGAMPFDTDSRIFVRSLGTKDRKGGDMAEWPTDLRVREYPAQERC